MAKSKKAIIKQLYLEGLSESDIALRVGCTRGTVSYHKGVDKKSGIDWDELRTQQQYNRLTGSDNFEQKQQVFLTTLFEAFEDEKKHLQDIEDPLIRVDALNKFAQSYYKVLKPSANDCKGVADEAARIAIGVIIDIAEKKKLNESIACLHEHIDEIVAQTVKLLKAK